MMDDKNLTYGKIDCEIYDISYEVPQFFLDYLSLQRTKDIMPVMFKLAHADVNANKDNFQEIEMLKAIKTPNHKPLDWEHDRKDAIGTIIKSFFVKVRYNQIADVVSCDDSEDRILSAMNNEVNIDAQYGFAKTITAYASDNSLGVSELIPIKENEKSFILVIGTVWSQIHSDRAKLMISRSKNMNLKWSMEAFFQDEECSNCGNTSVGKSKEDYIQCECMKKRFDIPEYSRILRGITFAGAGVVIDPADSLADNLAIGENKNKNVEVAEMEPFMTFESKEQLEAYILERTKEGSMEEELSSLKETVASLTEQNSALGVELEESKAQLVEKETEFSAKLSECIGEIDELKNVVAAFKAKEKEELGLSRLNELKTAGMSIASDKESLFAVELSEKSEEQYNSFLDIISSTFTAASKVKVEEEVESAASIPSDLTGSDIEDEDLTTAAVTGNEEDKLDKLFAKSSNIRLGR